MVKKIALEEHFLCPGYIEYWTADRGRDAGRQARLACSARYTDFGELRLASMDKAGIARAVLALAGPGVQAERDTATAIRNAKSGNDFLAKEIQKRPDRYSGFAHLPMQDAKAAADELERCVRELKFCGAMINGHTNGQYLDHPSLVAVLGARRGARHADLPPSGRSGVGRARAAGPSGAAPRHLGMGLRDRLARAAADFRRRVRPLSRRRGSASAIMGETLPFLLWRFDSRAGPDFYNVGLKNPPSHYIKKNIEITTSGMCSAEPLNCAIAALGHDRIMFGADYPFEKAEEAGHWLDSEKLDEKVRADIAYNNAVRLLKL